MLSVYLVTHQMNTTFISYTTKKIIDSVDQVFTESTLINPTSILRLRIKYLYRSLVHQFSHSIVLMMKTYFSSFLVISIHDVSHIPEQGNQLLSHKVGTLLPCQLIFHLTEGTCNSSEITINITFVESEISKNKKQFKQTDRTYQLSRFFSLDSRSYFWIVRSSTMFVK
jgi:hypothetical protein